MKVITGLNGQADIFPKNQDGTAGDGIITVDELGTYLREEIQIFTDQNQNPLIGDISMNGSRGSFFFLDRSRQVENGIVKEYNPLIGTSFGIEAEEALQKGIECYRAQDYKSAIEYFQQAAMGNNTEAMSYLGYIYSNGLWGYPE